MNVIAFAPQPGRVRALRSLARPRSLHFDRAHSLGLHVFASLALTVLACSRNPPAPSTPLAPDAADRPDAPTPPPDARVAPAEPVDPGAFARNGCATDPAPPYITTGTATVTFRAHGSLGFSYRNVPARCGGAYPGQIVEGARSRAGDGAEFVVCMPDERRLDVGVLRRGRVSAGQQDLARLENPVRLRIGLERFVFTRSEATATHVARLAFGPGLRSASGSVPLAPAQGSAPIGVVEFEIDCRSR